MMFLEDRKKKLMAASAKWDDLPPNSNHHVPDFSARANPNRCIECGLDPKGASGSASNIGDMNREPLPPPQKCTVSTTDWSLSSLMREGKRFHHIRRLSVTMPALALTKDIDELQKSGTPVIIEGFHRHPRWPKDTFSLDWLAENGPKNISVRNVHDWSDRTILLSDFIAKSRAAPKFASAEEEERLYGKDAECPAKWNEWLHEAKAIPPSLLPDAPNNLLLNQPRSSSVETLMCYLGIGDTFTPCHKDLCASSGQNLMCYTENGGSSFWFMTKSSDAPEASRYFHELRQELDHETHVITVEQLANAPFDVYVAEQKLGDLVLVPPRSCHQVVNYGGITIKTSWSRMTLKGLETAYYHELPIYRRVCRPEIYRVRSTVHYTLLRKTTELKDLLAQPRQQHQQGRGSSSATESLRNDVAMTLKSLLQLFDTILLDEYSPGHARMACLSAAKVPRTASPILGSNTSATFAPGQKEDGYVPVSCDFCGADIFQSFFECRICVTHRHSVSTDRRAAPGDGFATCAGCYVEGRSCKCGNMDAMQCRPFTELLADRDNAIKELSAFKQGVFLPANKKLDLSSNQGTFRAACLLEQMRKMQRRDNKVCSFPKGNDPAHTVPFSWALHCKKCHYSKCFTHILLGQKVHAIDAILNHSTDSSHERHHQFHLISRNRYGDQLNTFFTSQKEGSKPDLRQQRVYNAMTYGTCKPINPAFMTPGWYDKNTQIFFVPDDDSEASEEGSVDARSPSVSDNAPTPAPPPSISKSPSPLLTAEEPNAVLPSTVSKTVRFNPSKRKREILDYVEVPACKPKVQSTSTEISHPGGSNLASAQSQRIAELQKQYSFEIAMDFFSNPLTSPLPEPMRQDEDVPIQQSRLTPIPIPTRTPRTHGTPLTDANELPDLPNRANTASPHVPRRPSTTQIIPSTRRNQSLSVVEESSSTETMTHVNMNDKTTEMEPVGHTGRSRRKSRVGLPNNFTLRRSPPRTSITEVAGLPCIPNTVTALSSQAARTSSKRKPTRSEIFVLPTHQPSSAVEDIIDRNPKKGLRGRKSATKAPRFKQKLISPYRRGIHRATSGSAPPSSSTLYPMPPSPSDGGLTQAFNLAASNNSRGIEQQTLPDTNYPVVSNTNMPTPQIKATPVLVSEAAREEIAAIVESKFSELVKAQQQTQPPQQAQFYQQPHFLPAPAVQTPLPYGIDSGMTEFVNSMIANLGNQGPWFQAPAHGPNWFTPIPYVDQQPERYAHYMPGQIPQPTQFPPPTQLPPPTQFLPSRGPHPQERFHEQEQHWPEQGIWGEPEHRHSEQRRQEQQQWNDRQQRYRRATPVYPEQGRPERSFHYGLSQSEGGESRLQQTLHEFLTEAIKAGPSRPYLRQPQPQQRYDHEGNKRAGIGKKNIKRYTKPRWPPAQEWEELHVPSTLERLRYDRPSDSHQPSDRFGAVEPHSLPITNRDSSLVEDLDARSPVVDQEQPPTVASHKRIDKDVQGHSKLVEPRREPHPQRPMSRVARYAIPEEQSQREKVGRDGQTASTAAESDLSEDWEDEYRQDEDIEMGSAPRVVKDSGIVTREDSTAPLAFYDATLDPWA